MQQSRFQYSFLNIEDIGTANPAGDNYDLNTINFDWSSLIEQDREVYVQDWRAIEGAHGFGCEITRVSVTHGKALHSANLTSVEESELSCGLTSYARRPGMAEAHRRDSEYDEYAKRRTKWV